MAESGGNGATGRKVTAVRAAVGSFEWKRLFRNSQPGSGLSSPDSIDDIRESPHVSSITGTS